MALATVLSQTLLYAGVPFYGAPWKSMMNWLAGDSYGVAFDHFRQNHSTALNLILHSVCMLFQLAANFAFLGCVDSLGSGYERVYGIDRYVARPASLFTAVDWCAYLWRAPAPRWCAVLSVLLVASAYLAAPRLMALGGEAIELYALAGFAAAVCVGSLVAGRLRASQLRQMLKSLLIQLAVALFIHLLASHAARSLRAHSAALNAAFVVLMLAAASRPDPVLLSVLCGVFGGRALGILTGQAWPCLYSLGFRAMSLQGAAHDISREEATLLALQRRERQAKVRFEWAHVTYFPLLVFHAIGASLLAWAKAAERRQAAAAVSAVGGKGAKGG